MMDNSRFVHVLGGVLVAAFIIGFATFVMMGATTNEGTPSAIRAESALITRAENASCRLHDEYVSISRLRREGLLNFKPVYNSVVVIPGPNCGTLVVGSPQYQLPAD
jgi:hypothetical protein